MGAEFVFAVAEVAPGVTREQAEARIAALSDEDYKFLADSLLGEDELEELEPEEADEVRDQVREMLYDGVDVVFDRYRRDVGWFQHGDGTRYVLTGGMTWGDEPTDAFQAIMAFAQADLGRAE